MLNGQSIQRKNLKLKILVSYICRPKDYQAAVDLKIPGNSRDRLINEEFEDLRMITGIYAQTLMNILKG